MAKTFQVGQTVKFVAGLFKGKSGVVQASNLPSGRVLVKIKGSGPDANGRRSKLGSTFAEASDLE